MGPSISTVQSFTTEAMQGGMKAALDDVIGTYQGRKISTGGKNPSEAGLELNSATQFFHEAEKQSFKLSGMGGSRMGAAGYQRFLRRKALIANTARPAPLAAFSEDAP